MKECRIVEDLMPLYADDLICEETAEFIKAHLENCPECRALWQRCSCVLEPLLPSEEESKKLKRALRKEQFKAVLGGISIMMVLCGIAVASVFYIFWEKGIFPVKKNFVSPNGNVGVQLVDWDTAGFFGRGEGSLVTTWDKETKVHKNGGIGQSGSWSTSSIAWEDIRKVIWSPDGQCFFAEIETVSGETKLYAYYLREEPYPEWAKVDTMRDYPETLMSSGWRPVDRHNTDLISVMTGLCREKPELASGWNTIRFHFSGWNENSDTLRFVYETDRGETGFLWYNLYEETIELE